MPEDILWKKYAERYKTLPRLIPDEIDPAIKAVVCIPVYAEPDVITTLNSLLRCKHDDSKFETILLYNTSMYMTEGEFLTHEKSWRECTHWIEQNKTDWIKIFPVYVPEMPDPKGGVGWARKIAMDEAVRRLGSDGIIICLDADCTVSENYFKEIILHFHRQPEKHAASIFFEHATQDYSGDSCKHIVEYEIHLRYLIQAQRWCGHPFAFHTVGSAMAVRRDAYMQQGGMNTRRAGEDFYFLHKFIETGNFFQINTATVIPSSRISGRVPFGTGRAMQKASEENIEMLTTHFNVFRMIMPLFSSLETLRSLVLQEKANLIGHDLAIRLELDKELVPFLESVHFLKEMHSIARQTSSMVAFKKRFFRFFNAFRMIKLMHYLRDHQSMPDVSVLTASTQMLNEVSNNVVSCITPMEILLKLRALDKQDHPHPMNGLNSKSS